MWLTEKYHKRFGSEILCLPHTLTATRVSPALLDMFLAIPSNTSPKAPLPRNLVSVSWSRRKCGKARTSSSVGTMLKWTKVSYSTLVSIVFIQHIVSITVFTVWDGLLKLWLWTISISSLFNLNKKFTNIVLDLINLSSLKFLQISKWSWVCCVRHSRQTFLWINYLT